MQKYYSVAINISMSLLIVAGFSFILLSWYSSASAEEVPSKAVLRIMEHIKANQEVINQTREAHIQFMAAKDSNIFDIGQLQGLCYTFDWSSMNPQKIEDCNPNELFQ